MSIRSYKIIGIGLLLIPFIYFVISPSNMYDIFSNLIAGHWIPLAILCIFLIIGSLFLITGIIGRENKLTDLAIYLLLPIIPLAFIIIVSAPGGGISWLNGGSPLFSLIPIPILVYIILLILGLFRSRKLDD